MDSLNLPDNFSYLPVSNKDGLLVFRIKEIIDKGSAYAWMELYSEKTKSTWRTAVTYPKSGRVNTFKVTFRCVHNTDRRATGVGPSKHTGCEARLTICVKKFTVRSHVRINDLLNKEYPTVVTLKSNHNHPTTTCDALKYRDLSSEIKLKFLKLFELGHSPASALRCHKTDLLLEYGADYDKIIIDGKYLPTQSVAHKLSEQKKEYKFFSSGVNIFEALEEFLNEYVKHTGGVAEFKFSADNEHYFIVLCTPTMLRAHEKLSQTSELVTVKESKDVIQDGHHIYFFVTTCAAGCIPIGIIITNSGNKNVFIEAVQYFKECLPKTAFFSKQYPGVVMIDNDLTVFSGLKKVFPSSVTLMCHFPLLRTVWEWLSDTSHNIEEENRQELFFKFRKLLYSQDKDASKQNLNELVERAMQLNHIEFISYIAKFMERETQWINFYRGELPTAGSSTNDYAELIFCLLRDCLLKKVKSFNVIQLVNCVTSRFEMFYRKRLIDCGNGKYTDFVLKMMMMPLQIPENFVIQSKGFGIFSVRDEKNELFYVSLEQGMCSCNDSHEGLCRHSSAVLLKLDIDIITAHDIASTRNKDILFYIANGVLPQSDGHSPMQALNMVEQSEELGENMSKSDTNITYFPKDDIEVAQHPESLTLEEVEKLESFFSRIMDGLGDNPKTYVPAVRKFLANVDALTDAGLLTGLYNFGK